MRDRTAPARNRAHASKIKDWRLGGGSKTASQTGQINEFQIWESIEFLTRRAIPFALEPGHPSRRDCVRGRVAAMCASGPSLGRYPSAPGRIRRFVQVVL
jgi:hypothetical protein